MINLYLNTHVDKRDLHKWN